MDQSAVSARLIGLMFVEKGLITEEQLEFALEKQRETGDRLGEILVSEFGVERLDLADALAEQWAEYEREGSAEEREQHAERRDLVAVSDEWRGDAEPTPATASGKRPIGEIFVERGLISEMQLGDALEEQKNSGRRLGEILVATGRLTRLELASALADQWASFQKLRPPGEEPPTEARMVPMPVSSLPSPPAPPSPELAHRVDELATRVEELAARDVSAVPAADGVAEALVARVDQLESSLAEREPTELDELRSQLAEVTARIESLPETSETELSIGWRSELAEVAGNLRTRIERVEQGLDGGPSATDVTELRGSIEELAARIDSLPAPSEEWREPLAELRSRLDALPSGEWRPELAEVAESLRTRIERVEQIAADGYGTEPYAELRSWLEALQARVDGFPAGSSEEWRERMAELAARLDALPRGEWKQDLAELAGDLRARLERVEERAIETGTGADEIGQLRAMLEALGTRVDALPAGPFEEWREPLAELAHSLHSRLERVELGAASGQTAAEVAALRSWLEALQAHVDGLPTGAAEEWRDPLDQLARRVDALAAAAEGWRDEISATAAHVDAIPPSADAHQGELRELVHELGRRVDQAERGLASMSGETLDWMRTRIEEVAAKVGETDGIETRLRESLASLADERIAAAADSATEAHRRLDEVAGGADRSAQRVDELAHRVEELSTRRDATDVEQSLGHRIGELEGVLDGLREGLAGLPPSLEERLAEVNERAASAAGQAAADIASFRHEIDELRSNVDAARRDAAERVDEAANALRGEVEATARHTAESVADDVRAAIEESAARVEHLAGELASAEQRVAGRSADLSALRARLETVESALGGALGWNDAVDSANARVESLEVRMTESLAAEAVERDDQIETLRAELDEQAGAFQRERVKRKELRELREAIERVDRRMEKRRNENAAAARATEAAVKKGMESIAGRLTASGEAYLDTGRDLSRSIAGLGMALAASDALRLAEPRETDSTSENPEFLAFAPTAEGYRLLECEGSTPTYGSELSIEDCEGPLVVTRIGASPLPFDRRPCVYLEPSA